LSNFEYFHPFQRYPLPKFAVVQNCAAFGLFLVPYYQKDIELVEGVQRRATKLIDSVRNLHYEERIKKLNSMTLEKRRHKSDLLETF